MNSEFVAYYSKAQAFMFLALSLLVLIFIAVDIYVWHLGWLFRLAVGLLSLTGISFSILCFTKSGVAIEVIDDTLILHKSPTVTVALTDVLHVSIYEDMGTFLYVKTKAQKIKMAGLIKNNTKKKKELTALLQFKGIAVKFVEYSANID